MISRGGGEGPRRQQVDCRLRWLLLGGDTQAASHPLSCRSWVHVRSVRQAERRMPPSRGGVGDELNSRLDDDDDDDDGGQWEDYTCQGSFEDLIRSLEVVLREWGACDTGILDAVGSNRHLDRLMICRCHRAAMYIPVLICNSAMDRSGCFPSLPLSLCVCVCFVCCCIPELS